MVAAALAGAVALGAEVGMPRDEQDGQAGRPRARPSGVTRSCVPTRTIPTRSRRGSCFATALLYESTGLNGKSSLRRVALDTGRVLQRTSVDRRYFAEGLAAWGPNLVQLTWDTNIGFVYDRASFKLAAHLHVSRRGLGPDRRWPPA